MNKAGRWTQVEPAKLLSGAEGGEIPPPQRGGWKRVAIVAGIAAGVYLLWPSSESLQHHDEATRAS